MRLSPLCALLSPLQTFTLLSSNFDGLQLRFVIVFLFPPELKAHVWLSILKGQLIDCHSLI